jgi:superfamily II DNA or RNA helicase
MNSYGDFIQAKAMRVEPCGFSVDDVSPHLFGFQSDIVKWALRRGRSAVFADCGMGKTAMQLEWASHVVNHTGGRVLILAPLSVAQQTVREADKFGVKCPVRYVRKDDDITDGITIVNYEMMHAIDVDQFSGVVLDESSIIKAFDGKMRNQIVTGFRDTPYKLACTATPAPNDHMELGNHAEFLGVMTRAEMLSMFFAHDGGETSKWRLKGHAVDQFWKWVCGWAVMVRKPSDIGHSDDGFVLPPIDFNHIQVDADYSTAKASGMLFPMEAQTLQERRGARRGSTDSRVRAIAEIVNASDEQWVMWCDLNAEGDALEKAIRGATQVSGSDTQDDKEQAMSDFASGNVRVLVTKPSIAGFGMNWQHCRNMAFVGMSDSYEQIYQATRRCWRFGQTKTVNVHFVTSELEGAVVANVKRKEQDATEMADKMVEHMKAQMILAVKGAARDVTEYNPKQTVIMPSWMV